VSRVAIGVDGAVRTVSLSGLFSVVGIRVLTAVDVAGTSSMVHVPVPVGRSCRYIRVRVPISDKGVTIRIIKGGVRAVTLSGLLFSIGDISGVTAVHVGGASGMVHVPISVGRSCRYIGVWVPVRVRDRGVTIRVDKGGAIRAVSLSSLFSVGDIGVLAAVDVACTSSMVNVPVSVGRSCRYIGVRVPIRDRGVAIRVDKGGVRAVTLSGLLFSVGDISGVTAVHVGGASGVVYVPVSVSRSCRYIGVRVSKVRCGRIASEGIIRTVSLSSLLFSVGDISGVTTVHVRGASGMVHVPVSVGRSCRYIGVGMSDRVVGIVVRRVDWTVTVVVRGVHGSMTAFDHGRAGRSAHMNLLMPSSLGNRQETGQEKKCDHG